MAIERLNADHKRNVLLIMAIRMLMKTIEDRKHQNTKYSGPGSVSVSASVNVSQEKRQCALFKMIGFGVIIIACMYA